MKKKNIGSTFDSFLREEGMYEEVSAVAIKRVVARQVEDAMREKGFTKAEMARRMHTSRAALDRLLDPEYEAVTLSTLRKAAVAAGVGVVVQEPRLKAAGTFNAVHFLYGSLRDSAAAVVREVVEECFEELAQTRAMLDSRCLRGREEELLQKSRR